MVPSGFVKIRKPVEGEDRGEIRGKEGYRGPRTRSIETSRATNKGLNAEGREQHSLGVMGEGIGTESR